MQIVRCGLSAARVLVELIALWRSTFLLSSPFPLPQIINGTLITIATVNSRTAPLPPRYSSLSSPNYTGSHQPQPRPAAPTASYVPRPAGCNLQSGQVDRAGAHFVIVAADARVPDRSRVPSCMVLCRRGHMGENQPGLPFASFLPLLSISSRPERVIRTGRIGRRLNHRKEHTLVGVKPSYDSNGNLKFPSWVNRGQDTDIIVSVRETSRKPGEVYRLIERMGPGGRKIEIFGRKHNTRLGWVISHKSGRQC